MLMEEICLLVSDSENTGDVKRDNVLVTVVMMREAARLYLFLVKQMP